MGAGRAGFCAPLDMVTGYCRTRRDDLTCAPVRVGSIPGKPCGSSRRCTRVLRVPGQDGVTGAVPA